MKKKKKGSVFYGVICSGSTEPCNPERRKNTDRGFAEQGVEYEELHKYGNYGQYIDATAWQYSQFQFRRKCDIPPSQAVKDTVGQLDHLKRVVGTLQERIEKLERSVQEIEGSEPRFGWKVRYHKKANTEYWDKP